MKEGQKAIYFMTGDGPGRLAKSPQLEGFSARDIEVLLLTDPVDSFWVTAAPLFDGKPFKSVTQGSADLSDIGLPEDAEKGDAASTSQMATFIAFLKSTLGDAVTDVRASERLTESAVCLVAPENGPDRQIERLLSAAGRMNMATRPVLEVNPRHSRIARLAGISAGELSLRQDAAHLLLDEARILDGDKPLDPRAFSERLERLLDRALPSN